MFSLSFDNVLLPISGFSHALSIEVQSTSLLAGANGLRSPQPPDDTFANKSEPIHQKYEKPSLWQL